MIIDSKLPGFKGYLAENRLNNGGVKTTIDQSAVAAGGQNDVCLNLQDDESNNSYEKKKKKNKDKDQSKNKNQEELKSTNNSLSSEEIKIKNLKLLNLV